MKKCRTVITGLGLVCPVGLNVSQAWTNLNNGVSGIRVLEDGAYDAIPSKVAAQLYPGFDYDRQWPPINSKVLSKAAKYALVAVREALIDSRLLSDSPNNNNRIANSDRIGCSIGVGMVDLSDIVDGSMVLNRDGYSKLSPFYVPRILPNTIAGLVCQLYELRGPSLCISTACSTGLHSIADALNYLRAGHADVMVCGATEAPINPLSLAGFCRLRALSTAYNQRPTEASRPFDRNRDGFVIGEGAAILILETLDHARHRNASVYAEVLGAGYSNDACHLTKPPSDGCGAQLCMRQALSQSGLEPHHVQYVNAHATSTPAGDRIESAAIASVFRSAPVFVSSTKGSHGHLLGSAGCLESIFVTMAVKENRLLTNRNLMEPDENTEIRLVRENGLKWPDDGQKRRALKNSFGFGGTNCSLVFAQFDD